MSISKPRSPKERKDKEVFTSDHSGNQQGVLGRQSNALSPWPQLSHYMFVTWSEVRHDMREMTVQLILI